MGYLIGADIGSQSVKVILLDPDGLQIGSAGQACTMSHPASGWAGEGRWTFNPRNSAIPKSSRRSGRSICRRIIAT